MLIKNWIKTEFINEFGNMNVTGYLEKFKWNIEGKSLIGMDLRENKRRINGNSKYKQLFLGVLVKQSKDIMK